MYICLSCAQQKMWNMYNPMKLNYFGLNVRLLFTDLFQIRIRILFRIRIRIRIRIQNIYIGSGSDPDPAKSFGSFRIRIRNTAIHNIPYRNIGYLLYRTDQYQQVLIGIDSKLLGSVAYPFLDWWQDVRKGSPVPPGRLVMVDEVSGFRVALLILHTQIIKNK